MNPRKAAVKRETKETTVKVELNVDGSGQFVITTGIRMFDHLLAQLSRHGVMDLRISATGSDQHHLVEDVGICLGKAFQKALGDSAGIVRIANSIAPMDESLALVAVDVSGRGYASVDTKINESKVGDLPSDLIRHFFVSFATEAKINLHVKVLSGINDHHKAEGIFKALARALDAATRIDNRIVGEIPSTKGKIETQP